jgi:hypothetical protein
VLRNPLLTCVGLKVGWHRYLQAVVRWFSTAQLRSPKRHACKRGFVAAALPTALFRLLHSAEPVNPLSHNRLVTLAGTVVGVQKKSSRRALDAAGDRRPDIADTVNSLGFNRKLMPEKKMARLRERRLD